MRRSRRNRQFYGAGLARYLRKAGIIAVFEVERPKRRHLRREGKSDSREAEALQPGRCCSRARRPACPKEWGWSRGDDPGFESCSPLCAEGKKPGRQNQLQALRVTAPEKLRERLRGLPTKEMVAVVARFRPGCAPIDVETERPSLRCVR